MDCDRVGRRGRGGDQRRRSLCVRTTRGRDRQVAKLFAHRGRPCDRSAIDHWRLFIDMIGESLAGKKKLMFDRKAPGRRHLFLGLPQARRFRRYWRFHPTNDPTPKIEIHSKAERTCDAT